MQEIPKPTIRRLAVYYRCLERLEQKNVEKVSSKELSKMLKIKDSQVRKDLSYFGTFGRRGVGYNVKELKEKIKEILGLNKQWSVIILGAGNIGKAIARYKQIEKDNFKVVAVFDVDKRKIGTQITPELTVRSLDELDEFVKKNKPEIAVLAVPADAANPLAERLEKLGIKGIICFAPVTLTCSIPVEYVDITVFFKTLVHFISRGIQ
ncbi:redox-sensing transcriptional repressor Rex [Pseudothermotoga thermarum]|uniref:Redox-sensing transcriptional repressor Rex n=1 Tax=Pseudothermotoga thermarum DSM 5069 TaxID=688269 RepID=F7YUT3_9THEM|nr:redox-sensing transcriptional repressor Rex [Pseudothermotoga thermarum]AEH50273.1 Rex DNA-binding domain protein [Pseudothermotoga thermarum DSM 5069]